MKSCCRKKPALQCGKCHYMKYCSYDCQRKDWPRHKIGCEQICKMEGYAKKFASVALKNQPFLAFASALHTYYSSRIGPGRIEVLYCDTINSGEVLPLEFSIGRPNDYTDIIKCEIVFAPGIFEDYMVVYYLLDGELRQILEVDYGDAPTYAKKIAAKYMLDFELINPSEMTPLLIGGTKYCGIMEFAD